MLEVTSQTWLATAEIDRPVWRHWLIINVPWQPNTSTGLLLINGGSNDGSAPAPEPLFALAAATGAVVADLQIAPSQPLTFTGNGAPRSEDALITCTRDRHLQTGDEKWPTQFPMLLTPIMISSRDSSLGGGRCLNHVGTEGRLILATDLRERL